MNPHGFTARLRGGEWLEPRLVAFAAWLMLTGTVLGLAFLVVTATGNVDLMGRPLGTDFSSFWTAGRLVLEGTPTLAYDWPALAAAEIRLIGSHDFFAFAPPPPFLLVMAPLAALPYLPALLLWQSVSGAAAIAAVWRIVPSRRIVLLALAFPGVFLCAGHGQNGFLTATLLAGGMLLLGRAEWLAGVCFGLLLYKPQFGLILPLALMAGGHWRALAAAAATVLTVAALTFSLWGWPIWQAYLDALPLQQREVVELGAVGFHKFLSTFAWIRMLGGSLALAYTVQTAATLATVTAVMLVWRHSPGRNLKGAALLIGALLSSPYELDYDLIVFGMGLVFLVANALEHGFRPWEKTFVAFAWFSPLVARGITDHAFIPLGFLTLAVSFIWVVRRAFDEPVRLSGRNPIPAG